MSTTTAERAPGRRAKGARPARPVREGGDPQTPARGADERARRALSWGAGALILGLALVGVGADTVGMVPVLAGLLALIYGIHRYGRLGPEGEDGPPALAKEAPPAPEAREPKARGVEKRRRMDKSPPP